MSGIDFARFDLPPGLLCELVLKDEFTFQILTLEIFPKTRGGEGALLYNQRYGCASGIFKPLPLCRPKFRQNFGPFADKWRKLFENIYPKMPDNEFLAAVYLCINIIGKFHKIPLLLDQRKLWFYTSLTP